MPAPGVRKDTFLYLYRGRRPGVKVLL